MPQRIKISEMPLGRVQNKMIGDPDLQIILARWREWSQLGVAGSSGYKTRTIEHQLMIEGALTKVTGSLMMEDPECEQLDAAIAKLPDKMKKAIKLKYLFNFTNKDAAQAVRMSLSGYKRFICRCRSSIISRFQKN